MSQTTKNDPKSNAFKKLDNDGRNYSLWAIRCRMVLQGLNMWDIVDPTAHTSVCLGTQPAPTPIPSCLLTTGSRTAPVPASIPMPTVTPDIVAEWNRKNAKALSQLSTCIDDMPLHLISMKTTTRDAWQALSDHYNGVGALDASILSARLHRFQLDNSKSLEPQINLMHDM